MRVKAQAPDRRPLRLLWEQTRLAKLLDDSAVNVHHAPHYTMPERASVPTVVTIHDMTLFDHPEWHERTKVKVFQRAIRVATEKAAGLVAVSNDTAWRLRERFGDVDVTVIPHGVDHQRFSAAPGQNDEALLRQFAVPARYIAFVGTLEPRKNLPALLDAFDRLAPSMPDMFLVLAGGSGWHGKDLQNALLRMNHRSRVLQLGFVPDAVIPPLLRRARAVAYPAFVEGFGLPALEALACGAPLVTTTGSAMEEVVADAARLVEPTDIDALTDALRILIDDEAEAARLRARGPEVAAGYTWTASAHAHAELYQRIGDAR